MKRIFRSLAALLIIVISFSAISFAWLASGKYLNFPSSFGGSATPAYFAGGDGSKDNPFRITNPVHLYNLAWLQYLGYFNRREGFNNDRDQTYFALDGNIDMRGRAIPPIGTEEYPFIGKFDGNGHKVTNLTISNKKGTGDLVYSPTNAKFSNNILRFVDDSKAHDIEIVGMFGVTGDYDGYFNKYKAGGHTVDGTIASVSNFYVDKIHVRSNSAKTLAGLAAGYIGGNFSNVGVYRSDIKFAANAQANGIAGDGVLSKYSLVGAYNEDLITWDDANTWGGSIDMRMLARRINYMASSAGKGTAYYTSSNSYVPKNIFYKNAAYNYYGNIFETTKKNNANLFNYMINWKGNANYSLTASLLGWETYGYTYLPLNVDKGAMGLNSITDYDIKGGIYKYESSNNVFQTTETAARAEYMGKIIDQYNPNSTGYTAPEKTAGNTGYIVGQSSSSSAFDAGIQVTVSSLNSNNSIYKSFGKTTPGNITYSSDPLCLLTHYKDENNTDTFAFIKDDYNKNIIENVANNNSDYTRIIDQTPHYKTIRSQFGPFMGELGYIYGLRFSSYGCKIVGSDGKTLSKVIERDVNLFGKTEKNYKLVTGAINFSVKSAGSITAIVGTYNQKNNIKQSAFNVYKIDDRNNLAVVDDQLQGVEEVKEVYKKTNEDHTITYVTNPSDAQGMDLVYNKEWYNNKNNNDNKQSPLKDYYAYYIEIPLEKGDYLISTDSNTLGYLMYLDIGANGEGSGETGYTMDKVRFVNSGMPLDGGNVNLSAYKPALIKLSGSSTAEEIAVFKRDEQETDGKLKLAYRIINNNANAITVTEITTGMTRKDTTLTPSTDDEQ